MSSTVRHLAAAVAYVGLLLALAGCGGAATPPPSFPPDAIVVTTENRTFSTQELIVPADERFSLVLVNRDGEAHNIAIRSKPGFDGELVFRHDPITASTVVLEAGPIPAGTYFFICEVHPAMTGTVLAQ
ncbi:MAG: cupredoxin domain-containing protein [Chloroflexota bacterium]